MEENRHLSTELGPGSSGTMTFKEQYGFELDPEKIKDIDRSKSKFPAVDMRRINDDEYMKEIEEKEKSVVEYLRQFAKKEE